MIARISGYDRKQSSCNKSYEKQSSCKKSSGHHKSSGKKNKSGGKKNDCHEHKSSGKKSYCYPHKSNGCKSEHKSSGYSDNSALPYHKEEKYGGKSNAEYAYGILSKLSLGQVIHRITLDNGKDLDRAKWAGFQNGNAAFSAVSYKTTYIVYVPLNKITSIAL
ncbi:hypothetical protein [Paenibacillus glycanilyticus]|uniref:Uncharacterized protein n=1 Tax=Paenibacillus glycanilyticus TaxID=126569 RepID=A0ABQ6NJN8_9BACL|nr:hypothetical protein [Paenibacillus glycanilyticus]GMK44994.1 hypothetical protein PghCCS26_21220 [Paenibacillus glycanilyticus]